MYCKQSDRTKEHCPTKRLDSIKQNLTREFQMYHNEQPRLQLMAGAPYTEECGTSMMNQHQWTQQMVGKNITDRLTTHGRFGSQENSKPMRLPDINASTASVNSNHSEISRAIEKISETNHLMAQQQMAQQRMLQALLLQQEQSNETQEIAQSVQTQTIRASTDATKQRGFDALFNRITKFDGKDPQKFM